MFPERIKKFHRRMLQRIRGGPISEKGEKSLTQKKKGAEEGHQGEPKSKKESQKRGLTGEGGESQQKKRDRKTNLALRSELNGSGLLHPGTQDTQKKK